MNVCYLEMHWNKRISNKCKKKIRLIRMSTTKMDKLLQQCAMQTTKKYKIYCVDRNQNVAGERYHSYNQGLQFLALAKKTIVYKSSMIKINVQTLFSSLFWSNSKSSFRDRKFRSDSAFWNYNSVTWGH